MVFFQLAVDLPRNAQFTGTMRQVLSLLLLVMVAGSGCARHKNRVPVISGAAQSPGGFSNIGHLILTPETGLSGRVVRINPGGRFVVLNFPVGHLPSLDQRLSVYRLGLKTAELKVTGPQLDDNVVADVLAGDVQVGDQVRDK
jgi:hypothetical protein